MFAIIDAQEGSRINDPYATKQQALLAARRRIRREPDRPLCVVWLEGGSPKLWLVEVTPTNLKYTPHWNEV